MTEIVQISDGLAIMRALEGVADKPQWAGKDPHWADLGFPVIARGVHAIFPLVVPHAQEGNDPRVELLSDVERRLQTALIHLYGGDHVHAENELDLEQGYGRSLVAAGLVVRGSSLTWWSVGKFAAVLVRSVDQESAAERLALHVIPRDWVWYRPLNAGTKREASRYRRIIREQAAAADADVVWSWPPLAPEEQLHFGS